MRLGPVGWSWRALLLGLFFLTPRYAWSWWALLITKSWLSIPYKVTHPPAPRWAQSVLTMHRPPLPLLDHQRYSKPHNPGGSLQMISTSAGAGLHPTLHLRPVCSLSSIYRTWPGERLMLLIWNQIDCFLQVCAFNCGFILYDSWAASLPHMIRYRSLQIKWSNTMSISSSKYSAGQVVLLYCSPSTICKIAGPTLPWFKKRRVLLRCLRQIVFLLIWIEIIAYPGVGGSHEKPLVCRVLGASTSSLGGGKAVPGQVNIVNIVSIVTVQSTLSAVTGHH